MINGIRKAVIEYKKNRMYYSIMLNVETGKVWTEENNASSWVDHTGEPVINLMRWSIRNGMRNIGEEPTMAKVRAWAKEAMKEGE